VPSKSPGFGLLNKTLYGLDEGVGRLRPPFFLNDYHRTSAGADCGALYFFKLDSGGVSGMSGEYGLIVPTG
jgi:hypothetical protein